MNNYSLTEEIGRGNYSVVYKGRRKQSIEYYAIKSVEKQNKEKVLNEVSMLHELDHVNILKFYNWYETPNHLWLIVEYCTGGDLLNLLKQDLKLPEFSIQMFVGDLLSGLQ
jgi:serine/threonine-protein kinase ULK4